MRTTTSSAQPHAVLHQIISANRDCAPAPLTARRRPRLTAHGHKEDRHAADLQAGWPLSGHTVARELEVGIGQVDHDQVGGGLAVVERVLKNLLHPLDR